MAKKSARSSQDRKIVYLVLRPNWILHEQQIFSAASATHDQFATMGGMCKTPN